MPAHILVATPHAAFGELIRLSLLEQGHYQVDLVKTASKAREFLLSTPPQLAIVDSDLEDENFVSLSKDMLTSLPDVRLVIIPPENDRNHPTINGLVPHGYLSRPFYLPDMLEMVAQLTNQKAPSPSLNPEMSGQDQLTPTWINNLPLLVNCLEKQISSSDAVGALLIKDKQLQATGGSLPVKAAQEMTGILMRYWDQNEQSDLMRYVRLEYIKGDLLSYSTRVVDSLLLVMVFEPGASIRYIRPLTRQLAQTLMGCANIAMNEVIESGPESAAAMQKPISSFDQGASGPVKEVDSKAIHGELETHPALDLESEEPKTTEIDLEYNENAVEEEEPTPPINILTMLGGAIPSPDPDQEDMPNKQETANFSQAWSPESWSVERSLTPDPDGEPQPEPEPILEAVHVPEPIPEQPGLNAAQQVIQEQAAFQPNQAKEDETRPTQVTEKASFLVDPEEEINPLEDTRPRVLNTIQSLAQLEPISPALSLLRYTCVLLPRLPQHYLTGGLADKLAQWVQQMCLAFGWRLEGISIRPEYLQWSVQVSPFVSPGYLVRIIRQRTSSSIFNSYEDLKEQNPSGDFWALGYLIISGSQPPSALLLREYILQTRKRQGINKI